MNDYLRLLVTNNEIILDIHMRLTIGLDELFLGILEGYDPYFSGAFRKENNIKVGNIVTIKHKLNTRWL